MGQVTVSLNGQTYRLRCADGEEQRLFALVEHVRSRVDALTEEFGQVGDDQLLLLSALLVTEELFALQEGLQGKPGISSQGAEGADADFDGVRM